MLLYPWQTSQCSVSKHERRREHVLIKQIDGNTQFPAFSLITVQNISVSACERYAGLFHQIDQLFMHYSYALHCKGEWTAHIHKSKMSKGQKQTDSKMVYLPQEDYKRLFKLGIYCIYGTSNDWSAPKRSREAKIWENELCRTQNIRRTHWKLETGWYRRLFSFITLHIKLWCKKSFLHVIQQ